MDEELMRKLLASVCLYLVLFCACRSDLWGQRILAPILQAAPTGGGGAGCNGTSPTGCTFRETFEGTNACWSGGPANCDNLNGWGNEFCGTNCVYSYATAPAPLQGSHSLGFVAGSGAIAEATFTGASTIYAGAVINFTSFSDFNEHIDIRDGSDNLLCGVEMSSGGTSFQIVNTGGTTQSSSSGLSTGTYYFQIKATVGTGTNAVCQLLYSTTGASGSWTTVTSSNGTWTATPANVRFSSNATGEFIVDDVRVYTAQMNWS